MSNTIIVFSGWRNWTDWGFLSLVLDEMLPEASGNDYSDLEIRVGDCKTGVDYYIRGELVERQIPFQVWEADWLLFGKSAGPIRNWEMLNGQPYPAGFVTLSGATTDGSSRNPTGDLADVLVAFPQPGSRPAPGSGTWGCIGEAYDAGVEVLLPRYPWYRRSDKKE